MGVISWLLTLIWQLVLEIVLRVANTFPTLAFYVQLALFFVHEQLLKMHSDYLQWLAYLAVPVIVLLVLPIMFILMVYTSALWLHMYRFRAQLKRAYATSVWDGARTTLAAFWDATGWIWYGYEVEGLENIPAEGPALIVFYHGPLPTDVYFVMAKMILYRRRMLASVGDRFLQLIPGMRLLCEVFKITPGSVESCIETLKKGELLCVSPGGVREALFSDPNYYNLIWNERLGFAKVAIEAKVPIIPMFTENCRESFRVPAFTRRFLRWLYEKFRLPLVVYLGGLPVKMRTYIGAPITYTDEEFARVTPQQVRDRVRNAIQTLIEQHQRLPGNILMALLDRIYTCPRCDKNKMLSKGIVTRRRPSPVEYAVPMRPEDEDEDISGTYVPASIIAKTRSSAPLPLLRSQTLPERSTHSDNEDSANETTTFLPHSTRHPLQSTDTL